MQWCQVQSQTLQVIWTTLTNNLHSYSLASRLSRAGGNHSSNWYGMALSHTPYPNSIASSAATRTSSILIVGNTGHGDHTHY